MKNIQIVEAGRLHNFKICPVVFHDRYIFFVKDLYNRLLLDGQSLNRHEVQVWLKQQGVEK